MRWKSANPSMIDDRVSPVGVGCGSFYRDSTDASSCLARRDAFI